MGDGHENIPIDDDSDADEALNAVPCTICGTYASGPANWVPDADMLWDHVWVCDRCSDPLIIATWKARKKNQ